MATNKIAILGAGNGGCAAAADLTLRGFEVRLFSRSESTIAALARRGEIVLIEDGAQRSAAPYFMSSHLPPVVRGADWIVITTPAVGHEYLAHNLANYLTDGQRILLNPGHTGGALHFAHALRMLGCNAEIGLCETVTLTYICRMAEPGRVEIYRRTTDLRCAAFPGKHTAELIDDLRTVFPNVIRAANVFETGFSNINAIMHPAGMLGNAGWIEKTAGDFLWYADGITPAIGRWIDAVDGERLAIAGALGLEPLRFVDIFYQAGLTTADGRQSGSAYQAIHESGPNRTIKSPPSLDHRYLREDIGFGLVPMSEIGRLVGVRTPVMDALIALGSVALNMDFRSTGLTLEKMGLAEMKAEDLPQILREGFRGKA
jgi:opine dehydrogenase